MDRFREQDEDDVPEYSICANPKCQSTLYEGDEIINFLGYVCCRNLNCLIAITGAREYIAGDENK